MFLCSMASELSKFMTDDSQCSFYNIDTGVIFARSQSDSGRNKGVSGFKVVYVKQGY